MQLKEFKTGQRVLHRIHGAGTVYYDSETELDPSAVTIEFDAEPQGWAKVLTVSKALVNEIQE